MKSLLIFPPGWNPCSPYLALPILKAYLEEHHNQKVTIKDTNVEFFDYIFSKDFLKRCTERGLDCNVSEVVKNTYKMYLDSIEEVDFAKRKMHSLEYLEYDVRKYVDTILSNAIYIINKTWNGLKISFNGIELAQNKNASRSVYSACFDWETNPYIEFYQRQVIPYINELKYDFIGISITCHTQLISALTLCWLLKENCPSVKHISLGGNYITRAANLLLKAGLFNDDFFDSIMLYDGEIACTQLLEALELGNSLDSVHNLIYLKNGKIIQTEKEKNRIINTCMPNFDGFPMEKYFAPSLVLPIYTSRSCYNKCAFCTIPNATSGSYRAMSVDEVVQNIKRLKEKYHARYFSIVDETFDITRMCDLADAILEADLQIYWYCETRFTTDITYEKCKKLYSSGCRQIQFGLESYNQRVLDKMNKNIQIEWIDQAIENCMKAGISAHMFFFTGFPTETYEEALRTYAYTNEKVTKSQLKYNVMSSRGYGTFGLEIGSAVWLHPEKYGVTIIPNGPENDLRLNVSYLVDEGLSQEESMKIVKSQNLRDSIQDEKSTDFELQWVDYIPEVHMVIKSTVNRGCDKSEIIRGLGMDEISKLEIRKVRVPTEVSLSISKTKLLFYNRHLNRAYAIPMDLLKRQITHDAFLLNDVFESNNKITQSIIMELEHFGFLTFENVEKCAFVLNNRSKLIKARTLKVHYNKNLNEWVIFNYVTNNAVAVNALSYKLLGLFEEAISFQEVWELLVSVSVKLEKQDLMDLFEHYLKHDILLGLI